MWEGRFGSQFDEQEMDLRERLGIAVM